MSVTKSSATGNSNAVVPFYGRCMVVAKPSPLCLSTSDKLIKITESVIAVANSSGSRAWKDLAAELKTLANVVLDPDRPLMVYQIELLQDGLLPYLGNLKARMHVDNQRFTQVGTIIQAIINHNERHPALLLEAVDEVIFDIRRSSMMNMWKSELLTTLEAATNKQWRPIIADNRRLLCDYGGKLLMLGLVGSIGWPIAFLYPLYKLSLSLLAIVQEWERHRRLSRQAMFDLAKTVVMLFAAAQLLSILATYASLGYTCLAAGTLALTVSSSDALIKKAAPIMAPHLAQLDQLMAAVGSADMSKLLQSLSRRADPLEDGAPIISGRVEELPDDSSSTQPSARRHATQRGAARRADARRNSNTSEGNSSPDAAEEEAVEYASHALGLGMRKRY